MKMFRISTVFFISLIILALLMPTFSGEQEVHIITYAGGSGTEADPYQISNWTHLNDTRSNLDKHYILVNDLNSSVDGWEEYVNTSAGWLPIGDYDTTRFTGTFDGQNYTIYDLYINRTSRNFIGLFGCVGTDGEVRNVGVVNANVSGGNYHVGGLVGYVKGATISNSYATGDVSGGSDVGGLVGGIYSSDGEVSNSYSTCNVSGDYGGGLVGFIEGTVSNSYATGDVNGSYINGGLVGRIYGGSGVVSNSYATGVVSGVDDVGGLVGSNGWEVSNSYATGVVSGVDDVGGLVGDNDWTYGTVSNSFWDNQTSGINISDGGTGKYTHDMQDILTYTDNSTDGLSSVWDMVDISDYDYEVWYIDDGEDYPRLNSTKFVVVETDFATDILNDSATLNGDFNSNLNLSKNESVIYFQYMEEGGAGWTETTKNNATSLGAYNDTISGLSENTYYTYRTAVEYDGDIVYGDNMTLQTKTSGVIQYELRIYAEDHGTVLVPGDGTFQFTYNEVVEIEAVAFSGYTFDSWGRDTDRIEDINANHTTIRMEGNYTVKATFTSSTAGTGGTGGSSTGDEIPDFDEDIIIGSDLDPDMILPTTGIELLTLIAFFFFVIAYSDLYNVRTSGMARISGKLASQRNLYYYLTLLMFVLYLALKNYIPFGGL